MQDQLSLFSQRKTTAEEHQSSFEWALDGELTAIDELTAIAGRWRSAGEYQELLNSLTRFPQYSIFNALLLYLQNPRAQRVATAGNWLSKYNRWPKPGARPLIILAPTAPVLFLYDVADTAGAPLAEPSAAKSSHGNVSLREIFRKTKANSDLHGICPRLIPAPEIESEIVVRLTAATRNRYRDLDLSSKASYLIMLNDRAARAENYRNLVSGLGQIFCGHYGIDANAWWPERAALSAETEKIEAQSVTYLVCGRQGATGTEAPFLTPYLGSAQAMPPFGLNAVIQAAGYIEEMGKRQWSAPKKKSRYRS